MKRIFYTTFFLVSLQTVLASVPPSTPASGLTFSIVDGNFLRLQWTAGNGSRRIVVARQGAPVTAVPVNGADYNTSSTFGNGDAILPGQFVVYDNTSTLADMTGFLANTTYHFAIYEYNGTGAATEYLLTAATASQSTLAAPTVQASNLVISNVTGSSVTLSWTNGNGNRRLVLARQGSPVDANPVDLTTYSSNSNFGTSTALGAGNYPVYNATGSSVVVNNLQPNTTYYFSVFEYAGNSGPVYNVVSPASGNQLTLAGPSQISTNLSFSIIDGNFIRLNWTSGNGNRRIVVARAGSPVDAVPVNGVDYAQNSNFTLAAEISPGQAVVYDNNGNLADITGLQASTTYHFRIYEYDGAGASISYLTASFASGSQSTLTAPVTQVSNLAVGTVTGNSIQLNWTNGSGTGRLVLAKQGSAVDVLPVDNTLYSPNANFGSGTQVGTGNYTVHRGTGSTVTINNLQPGTTYHFAVFEYNGNSGPVYNTTGPPTVSQLTDLAPTVPASGVSFSIIDGNFLRINWTPGNGSRRIVVARAGSPVDAVPVNGVDYAQSTTFSLGEEISPGQHVVFDNIGNLADITGFQANTTYHFRIYEYSGTGVNIAYLTSSFASASQATLGPPVTNASNLLFSNVSGNSTQLNWTNGSGAGRLVLAKAGSPVDANPVDLSIYSSGTNFGSGAQIGSGNYVVYRGTASTVTVNNLLPGTTYYYAVFEYAGNSGPVFNTTGPASGSQATTGAPTMAASNLNFNSIDGTSMRLNWTSGNGTRRIVVARAGSAVDAVPANGVDYAENANFNIGEEISPGQHVVYDNTSTLVDITGLQPNTVYHFRIYEYSGTGPTAAYLTASFGSASQSTSTTPTLQSSNISFINLTGNSVTVSWTNGDGANRLVVARQGSPVDADPTDLTTYNPGSGAFGIGSPIGTGNYVVGRTGSTTTNVSGLLSGTTYYFAVYEFNGSNGPVYLRPGATASATTLGAPLVQATAASVGTLTSTSMQINWTNGSGQRRLVLMKQATAVDAVPVDNTVYTSNSFFGSGSQLGSGNYVVFDGMGSSVTVTGLQPNATYHYAIFEFNAVAGLVQFLTSAAPTGSATTPSALPVSFLYFRGRSENSQVQLEWATAQEFNSAYFEVQRSSDGSNFTSLSQVAAAGNSLSRTDYAFTDAHPVSGTSYYRLKQVDIDNRFLYSPVLAVRVNKKLPIRIVNPVGQTLQFEWQSSRQNISAQIQLLDMNGRVAGRFLIQPGNHQLSVSELANGFYWLQFQSGDERHTVPFIKQ